MKYIRTKDGIAELVDLDKEHIYLKRGNFVAPIINKEELKIYKQADTIEELCDEFVVEYQTKEKTVFDAFDKAHLEYIRCPIDMGGFSLYGAVWCEQGLKYVAKMNVKGELELL